MEIYQKLYLYLYLFKGNKDKCYKIIANNISLLTNDVINMFFSDFKSINEFLPYLKNDEDKNKFIYSPYIFSCLFGKKSCEYFINSENNLNINFISEENNIYLYKVLSKDAKVVFLKSFTSEEKIVDYLLRNEKNVNEEYLLKLLNNFEDIENIKKLINIFKDEFLKSNAIILTNDKLFIKNNFVFLSEEDKYNYYNMLNDMELLNLMKNNPSTKIHLITYLKDENIVINVFNSLSKNEQIMLLKNKNFNDLLTINLFKIINLNEEEKSDLLKNILNYLSNKKLKYSLCNDLDIPEIKNFNAAMSQSLRSEKNNICNIETNINKSISFGLEFEFINKYSEVYSVLGSFLSDWKLKRETSIKDGLEVNSPALKFNINDLNKLKYVCNFFEKNNYVITDKCGGHIHIGFDIFKNAEQLRRLYLIYLNTEEIFYLISNKKGSLIRDGIKDHAYPLSYIFNSRFGKNRLPHNISLDHLVKKIRVIQSDRNAGINILNANDEEKNTIEFRIPNMEINYEELISNILLYLSLVNISVNASKEDDILIKKLCNNNENDVKLNILLELLFKNNENLKKVYLERYYENKVLNSDRSYFENNTSSLKL